MLFVGARDVTAEAELKPLVTRTAELLQQAVAALKWGKVAERMIALTVAFCHDFEQAGTENKSNVLISFVIIVNVTFPSLIPLQYT